MASQTFRDRQSKWMENVMTNPKLCDAVFVVGVEQTKLYGIRSLLSSMSPVLEAQLLGSFAESKADALIEFPTIPSAVFECIIRASFALDPLITAHTALPLLKATRMLQIEALTAECIHFLGHSIDQKNVLTVLNSAYLLNVLDAAFLRKCRRIILEHPGPVLASPGLVALHQDLVFEISSWEYLKVTEDKLWSACLKWAKHTVSNSIEFPLIKQSIIKTPGDEEKHDDSEKSKMRALLRLIIPNIRFPLMNKTFFVDKARYYLTRNEAESVMDHFLMNRKCMFSKVHRKSMKKVDHNYFRIVASSEEPECFKKLQQCWPQTPIGSQSGSVSLVHIFSKIFYFMIGCLFCRLHVVRH